MWDHLGNLGPMRHAVQTDRISNRFFEAPREVVGKILLENGFRNRRWTVLDETKEVYYDRFDVLMELNPNWFTAFMNGEGVNKGISVAPEIFVSKDRFPDGYFRDIFVMNARD